MESLYWIYVIVLYFLKFVHLSLLVFVFIGPFVLDKFWLLVLILYNIYVITCWYIVGYCFSTPIEEWFQKKIDKYDNSKKDKNEEKNPEKKYCK